METLHWFKQIIGILPWPCAVDHLCSRPVPQHIKAPPRSLRQWGRFVIQNQNYSENCVAELRSWMISNILMVNDSKTGFLIVGSKQQLERPYGRRPDHTCTVSTVKPECEFKLQLENGYSNDKGLPTRLQPYAQPCAKHSYWTSFQSRKNIL